MCWRAAKSSRTIAKHVMVLLVLLLLTLLTWIVEGETSSPSIALAVFGVAAIVHVLSLEAMVRAPIKLTVYSSFMGVPIVLYSIFVLLVFYGRILAQVEDTSMQTDESMCIFYDEEEYDINKCLPFSSYRFQDSNNLTVEDITGFSQALFVVIATGSLNFSESMECSEVNPEVM